MLKKRFSFEKNVLLLLALFWGVTLSAAKIGSVAIKPLNQDYDKASLEQVVFQTIGVKPGDEYKAAAVTNDIKALMRTGKFDTVRTEVSRRADGTLELTYVIAPKLLVTAIHVQGAKEYEEDKLLLLVKQKTNTPPNERLLAESRSAILDKYRDAGYYGTEVTTSRKRLGKGAVEITFVVKEEVRHKLKGVYFEGNTRFDQSQLRESIQTQRQWWRYIFRFGNYYNKEQATLDKEMLKKLYSQKGFLDFAIKDMRVEELPDDPLWVKVTFVLDEGEPYRISGMKVVGALKFTPEVLQKRLVSKVGEVFDGDVQETDIQRLRSEYEHDGYLDLHVWATHEKDVAKHTVFITYHVSEGKPSTIRNIYISGNEVTQDRVIRRELAIGPGDLGDQSKIRISKNRLMNLGYFEKVEVLPLPTEKDDVKDLRIELAEKATGQFSVGAGFSTEDSAVGFIEFSETNFDLKRLFDWPPKGAGQRLRIRVQVGENSTNFVVSHTEPWFLDRRLELKTEFFYTKHYEDEYEQRNIGAGQMLSWPVTFRMPIFGNVENWRMGVGYRIENVDVYDVDKYIGPGSHDDEYVQDHCLQDDEGNNWANRLIWRVSRDTRDAFRFPRRGSLATAQVEFVTSALGSYEDYGRFDFGYTHYNPLVRDLILKLSFDYSSNTGDDAGIFDRYFGGGVGTIRGFKRRDISPRDRYDDPIGGNSFFGSTVEILQPIRDFMYFSVFMDCGNAWWDSFELRPDEFNYSVGFGVQLKAIPVSLYYGYPLTTSQEYLKGRSGRLHFNIGLTY